MTPLTSEELRQLLYRLDGESADDLESEVLEFKSSTANYKSIRESVVALANAKGGNLVIGIGDRSKTRDAAIEDTTNIDPNLLRASIYDGTDPHITVDIAELTEPEGKILLISIPSTGQVHTTTDGVGKVRVGKESRSLTGSDLQRLFATRRGTDFTAQIAEGETRDAIDSAEIDRLRTYIRAEGTNPDLAGLRDDELLDALGLTEGQRVTIAALLLLGHKSALARHVPQHELSIMRFRDSTDYDFRHDLREPLLKTVDEVRRIIEANVRITTVESSGFHHSEIPDMSWIVVRESVLNAMVHRDYFINGSIQVSLRPDRLEVSSPGGFVGDVSPENVLRHGPVRRNHLLADVFQSIGLVNRAGLGVDRIFRDTLRAGKDFPRYESGIGYVRLTLPTRTHIGFARFVAERQLDGEELDLDDLMVLRSLMTNDELNRNTAARLLQDDAADAARILASLNQRGYIEVRGRGQSASYRLGPQFSSWDRVEPTIKGDALDAETAQNLILQAISDRGSVTNEMVREITGYERNETVNFLREMRQAGLVELRGRGRASRYVLPE